MPVKIQGTGGRGFAGTQPFCGIKLHWAREVGAVTGASLQVGGDPGQSSFAIWIWLALSGQRGESHFLQPVMLYRQ